MARTRVEQHLRAGGGRLVSGRRVALVAAVALVLIALIGLGSARSHWRLGDLGAPATLRPGSMDPGLADSGRPVSPHASVGYLLMALGLLGIAPLVVWALRDRPRVGRQLRGLGAVARAVVGAIARWLGVGEPPPLPPRRASEGDSTQLLAAVDLSLNDLEQEPDPRRAVIRAYARMEGALGLHGLARLPSETPLEYLARALASLRVGRASIQRLTTLFEPAKFSAHEIDGSMKADALAALRALRDELAEPAA
jgi:hypothetical protein